MQDQLTSYKTAKLAKEKGFIHKCEYKYASSINLELPVGKATNSLYMPNVREIWDAPTQSLLQKWLRDVHNIHVNPITYKKVYGRYDCVTVSKKDEYLLGGRWVLSFEEALEIGLYNALKTIKI